MRNEILALVGILFIDSAGEAWSVGEKFHHDVFSVK